MSTFIQLTALERNGKPFAKNILVDVNKITLPVVENFSGNSIIEVDADISYSPEYFGNRDKFVVDEDLDAINALTSEVFKGTIITKNGEEDLIPEALFVKSKIVGVVEAVTPGGNSQFGYRVMAQKSPEFYVVSETLATINT